jgi:peptidoglycan/xylan/chitin deacetylase (PgdA/CDA1 family)
MKRMALARHLFSRRIVRSLIGKSIRWSGVLAFNYHRVGDGRASNFDRGLWSADAETFADQVRFCKSHLDMIGPGDLPRAIAAGRGRYGMITFDDGYLDNYEVAFPILKAEGVPATFFITTGFVDRPQVPWWDEIAWMVRTSRKDRVELAGWLPAPVHFDEPDRESAVRKLLRAYKDMPDESHGKYLDDVAEATESGRCGPAEGKDFWMDWPMLRSMRAAGMTLGGHTVSHPVLARRSTALHATACARPVSATLSATMAAFRASTVGTTTMSSGWRSRPI